MANLLYPASTGHNTDDKYSHLVIPNLFARNVFQPEVTFTARYQTGPAGQIMVHKPGIATVAATLPGQDFSTSIVQDTLVTIPLDKQWNRDRKLLGVTAQAVAYDAAAIELELASREVGAGIQLETAKTLVKTTGIKVSDNITTETTSATIYDQIVDDRAKLRALNVLPDVLITGPKGYAKLLKAPEFQRGVQRADETVYDGYVGSIAGLKVFEYETFDSLAAVDDKIGGVTWAKGDILEYVMYDHEALSVILPHYVARVKDAEGFVGIRNQVEVLGGIKVTNTDCVLVKFLDASAAA